MINKELICLSTLFKLNKLSISVKILIKFCVWLSQRTKNLFIKIDDNIISRVSKTMFRRSNKFNTYLERSHNNFK